MPFIPEQIESFIKLGEEAARSDDDFPEFVDFIRPVYELTYNLSWTSNFDPTDPNFDETVHQWCFAWFNLFFTGHIPFEMCEPLTWTKRYFDRYRHPDETTEYAIDRIFSDEEFINSFLSEFHCAIEDGCHEMHGSYADDPITDSEDEDEDDKIDLTQLIDHSRVTAAAA